MREGDDEQRKGEVMEEGQSTGYRRRRRGRRKRDGWRGEGRGDGQGRTGW